MVIPFVEGHKDWGEGPGGGGERDICVIIYMSFLKGVDGMQQSFAEVYIEKKRLWSILLYTLARLSLWE